MGRLPFQIKICGVTNASDASIAIEAGATAIGLNFFSGSRRHIDPLEAETIARIDSRELAVVGVFVNHTPSEIAGIVTHVEPTWVQLHGDEPPSVIKHVKEAVDLPVMCDAGEKREAGPLMSICSNARRWIVCQMPC